MHVFVETPRGTARVRVSHRDLKRWYLMDTPTQNIISNQEIIDFCFKKINSFTKGNTIDVNSVVKLPRKKLIDWQGRSRSGK